MAPYTNDPSVPVRSLCTLIVFALAACSDAGDEYYPLAAGRWWYFQTQTTILDERLDQRFIVANLGVGKHNGEPVFIQRQSAGREVYFRRSPRGIERVGVRTGTAEPTLDQASTLILPADLVLHGSWSINTRLALIESRTFARQDKLRNLSLPLELSLSIASTRATVHVPAGRFDDCIRVDGTGTRIVRTDRGNAAAEVLVTHRDWYAPGVGLVKSTRSEISDSPFLKAGYYTQELLEFER